MNNILFNNVGQKQISDMLFVFKKILFVSLIVSPTITYAEDIGDQIERAIMEGREKRSSECTGDAKELNRLFATSGRDASYNNSCFIEISEIQLEQYQIIDVRKPRKYKAAYIKNSINIPLHILPSKGFLKEKKLLLVNEGLPQFEMGQYCQLLKEKGFKDLKILKDGIHGWVNNKKPLITNSQTNERFNTISVDDFFMDYEHDLIQVVNALPAELPSSIVKNSKKILTSKDAALFYKQLKKINSNGNSKPIVVVITREDYRRLNYISENKPQDNIYYLLGNVNSLSAYKSKHIAMNQVRLKGPKNDTCRS